MKKDLSTAFFTLVVMCLVLMAFSPVCTLGAEAPTLEHKNGFGHAGETLLHGTGQQTKDGGYVIAGLKRAADATTTNATTTNAIWTRNDTAVLIKTYTNLTETWTKEYGRGQFFSVTQTNDDGYIAAGRATVLNKTNQSYLVKTYNNGSVQWSKTFGEREHARCVQQTSDGYIMAGASRGPTAFIRKTDVNGNESWAKYYDNGTYLFLVKQTSDGGYIAAGIQYPKGSENSYGWILKIYANGTKVWDHSYGDGQTQTIGAVKQTSDGGYIAAGYEQPKGTDKQAGWLFKLNPDGKAAGMEHDYWLLNNTITQFDDVQQTSDGGYIAAGYTLSADDVQLACLVKTDAAGNELWNTTLYLKERYDCLAGRVQQTKDGGYFIVGDTSLAGGETVSGRLWAAKLSPDPSPSLLVGAFPTVINTMSNTANQVVTAVVTSISIAVVTRLLFQRRQGK
jgi:hypothetical protein